MTIFNPAKPRKNATAPTPTKEGGMGRTKTKTDELASLVLTSFLEDNFYEKKEATLTRMVGLVNDVSDNAFIEKLAIVARHEFNMRTTPVALLALLTLKGHRPTPATVTEVMFRGDEVITFTAAVKALSKKKTVPRAARYVAEVALNNLSQRKALRYMGGNKSWKLSDVIRVVHPTPQSEELSAIFKYVTLVDLHDTHTKAWANLDDASKRRLKFIGGVNNGTIDASKVSHERARSQKDEEGNKAEWSTLADDMGYMAILRNLRSMLTEVAASDNAFWDKILGTMQDRQKVADSKQFPYRFYNAYKALGGNAGRFVARRYSWSVSTQPAPMVKSARLRPVLAALESAVETSVYNLPPLGDGKGKTLVVIDTSSSMLSTMSEESDTTCAEVASVMGFMLARAHNATIVRFDTSASVVKFPDNVGILEGANALFTSINGGGTYFRTVKNAVKIEDYDNIIVLSDMQTADDVSSTLGNFKGNVFAVDLRGLSATMNLKRPSIETRGKVYAVSGFSDGTLRQISLFSHTSLSQYVRNWKRADKN